MTYDDLEPHLTELEYLIGVAGDGGNSYIPRSKPYPLPPMRPFRLGELFTAGRRRRWDYTPTWFR